MPKALCMFGMVVAVLLTLLFALDLAIKIPFNRATPFVDGSFIVCSAILGVLSWMTFREQR
jgi:hypothetical protein